MKILLVTEDFPPLQGGVFTFLHNLCLFSKLKVEVLASDKGLSRSNDFDQQQPYHIERIHLPRRIGFFKLLLKTFQVVAQTRPDVIFWGHSTAVSIIGHFIKKRFGVRFVMLVHGTEMNLALNGGSIPRQMLFSAFKSADVIFVNSQDTKKRVLKLGVSDAKLSLLNPGVNIQQFRPDVDTSDVIRQYQLTNKKVLLSVSRLFPKKNHAALLRVLPKVLSIFPETVYLIVGDGPEETKLKKICKDSGLKENVIFIPYATGEDLVKLYNLCDLFVMFSKSAASFVNGQKKDLDVESFGIVYVEAGACGKPVVGARSAGIPDAVIDGETGLLIEPEDEDGLAEAIIQLLTEKAFAQSLGERGHRRAVEELSWEKVADRFDGELSTLFRKEIIKL